MEIQGKGHEGKGEEMKRTCKVCTFWSYQRRLVQHPWAISIDVIRCRGDDTCKKGFCLSVVIYQDQIEPRGASVEEYIQTSTLAELEHHFAIWFTDLGIEFTTADLKQISDFIGDIQQSNFRYAEFFEPECTYVKGKRND